jgi:hypothetical protein
LQSINERLTEEKNSSKEQVESLTKKLEQAEEENELIIQQLHHVQESLENNLEKLEAQNKTKIQLEQDLAHSENALKKEKQLIKQKTAELQSINDELVQVKKSSKEQTESLTKKLEQAEEENELIIQQLHNVQEELEYQFISKSELTKQHSIVSSNKRDAETYSFWIKGLYHRAAKENYKSNRRYRNTLKKQIQLITQSSLFDEQWYLDTYPDLRESSIEPALHYLLYGVAEGRNPSAGFNTMNYIFTYTDVAESGLNPLVHFIKFGQTENREADPRRKCLPAPKNNQ